VLCGQAADAPPLAPGAAAGQTPTARPPAWSSAACGRDAQPDPPAGAGEPSLGLHAHPGRAAEARNQRLGHHGRNHVARLGPRAGAAPDRPQLGRVTARASAEHARRRSPLRARWRPRGHRVREEGCNSGRGTPRSGSRAALHQRCRGALALLADIRSAAAVGSRRSAFSERLAVGATAVIAAMACARWTKNTPELFARTNGSTGVSKPALARARRASRNHTSGSQGRCQTLHPAPQHNGPTAAPSPQLNRVSLPHKLRRICSRWQRPKTRT
jgi:hypothetical protein